MCINYNFSKPVFLYSTEKAVYKFIESISKEFYYCKKLMNKHFNKNLVVSFEDEKRFQSSNKCWICNKLFTDEDKKVREHDHISGRYRGPAHSHCNINLKLTKKVSVIFHHLRGYCSHLIMPDIGKFDIEISVLPNILEKNMAL